MAGTHRLAAANKRTKVMRSILENSLQSTALKPDPYLLQALAFIPSGAALEIGCSAEGQNSLALQAHGFKVTCYEPAEDGVEKLKKIIAAQGLSGINCLHRRADYRFNGSYQLICSLKTSMHYHPPLSPQIIADMQAATVKEGFNLIVAPLIMPDSDWSAGASFAFQSGELSHYYRKWHILRYDQHAIFTMLPGIDSQPVSRRFARILAQKVRVKQL